MNKKGKLFSVSEPKDPLALEAPDEPPPACSYLSQDSLPSEEEFRQRYFGSVSRRLWNDWKWQLRYRINSLVGLSRILELLPEESQLLDNIIRLPMAVTPYYLSLFFHQSGHNPLRRCVIPTEQELIPKEGESEDPLREEAQSPLPGIVHRYPDRVLFLATGFCSTYCRYCTRSRMVGKRRLLVGKGQWDKAISYIEAHSKIRDVLISGGDPLTLSDEALQWILHRLRSIRHVEVIRIGTKVPAVLPQRITKGLCNLLKKFHPLYMSLHFTHPQELTPEVEMATSRLADAGIPLGSQTVLLKGINDSVDTLRLLFTRLMALRVRPYYLYQCDPIVGSSHFRTKVEEGIKIMRGLRGFISGYAVPVYVIDAPGGGGKVVVDLGSVVAKRDGKIILKNFKGLLYEYPE